MESFVKKHYRFHFSRHIFDRILDKINYDIFIDAKHLREKDREIEIFIIIGGHPYYECLKRKNLRVRKTEKMKKISNRILSILQNVQKKCKS